MRNDCRYLGYADEYSHGELNGDMLSEFESHLKTCRVCGKEVETLRRLGSDLIDSYEFGLDQRFNYAVLKDLRAGRTHTAAGEIRIALEDIVISLATLLVIVLIAIQVFSKPKITPTEMAGRLTNIEKSSLEESKLSNDQVLELVLRSK